MSQKKIKEKNSHNEKKHKKCDKYKNYLQHIDGVRSVLFLDIINHKTGTLVTTGQLNNFVDKVILPYFKNIFIHEVCTDKSKNEKFLNNDNITNTTPTTPSIEQCMKVVVINHEGGKENEKRLDKIQIAWDFKFHTSPSSRTDIPAKIVSHNIKL